MYLLFGSLTQKRVGPNGMREQVGIQAIGIKLAQKRGRLPVKGNKLFIDLNQLKTRLVSHDQSNQPNRRGT
jgi:hypothetical protein